MKYTSTRLLSFFMAGLGIVGTAQAQSNFEFYNDGALIHVENNAEIYVEGDVHMLGATGNWEHNGFMEVQGDMYSDAQFQQSGTGTVRMHNRTVNTGASQFISGSFAVRGGTGSIGTDDGSFYNLELANDIGIVYLVGTGNVADVRNQVNFDPLSTGTSNRIITHDYVGSGVPANGAAYDAVFGIMNTTAGNGTMLNNSIDLGGDNMSATDQGYVQGKLRRAINPAGGTYGFVFGLEPSASTDSRGFQYADLNFSGANTYDVITGYFQRNSSNDPGGTLTECSGETVDYFGGATHGEWVFNALVAGTGTYAMRMWPQDHAMPAHSMWVITKDDALTGTADDCDPTLEGLERTGFSGFSEFGPAAVTTLLDVELLELVANPIENKYIHVHWTTSKESDVSHFEIERSKDDANFEVIAREDAAGNSIILQNYHLEDHEVLPNVNYYYRIRTVNLDGTSEYSYSVVARLQSDRANQVETVTLYPNPVSGYQAYLDITALQDRDLHMVVYDAIGRRILDQDIAVGVGYNQFSLNTSAWPGGTYFVQVIGEDFSVIKELIKQ